MILSIYRLKFDLYMMNLPSTIEPDARIKTELVK